jgi:CheY-like chemotaxis protein
VLCVDDEPHVLEGLMRVLSEQFEVVTSTNPLGALALLERDGNFAVVISDINMPQMDGLTFLRQVQALSPTTTRLALTGTLIVNPFGLPPDAVFRIIAKPCPPEVLKELVLDAYHYHALMAASPVQPIKAPLETSSAGPSPALAAESAARDLSQKALPHLRHLFSGPVVIVQAPAEAGELLGMPARIGLRMTARTIELLPGLTILGRSRTCHIPVDDPKVSRRHACFANGGGELTVRNLSSTNRLLLNGLPIEGDVAHPVQAGDRISVGSQEIEVCTLGDYCPSFEPTQRLSSWSETPSSTSDGAPTLGKLAEIASKCARLGQRRDAERILRPLLDGLLRYCRAGQAPLPDDVKLAIELALGVAESARVGEWVSYVFALLSEVGLPPEADVLERLYRVVPMTPGISMAAYRGYLEALTRLQDRFSPAQRFLVRRVQGLETALMRSAHL